MDILVTGGLGFIGSHTVVELLNSGHSVIIADNLVNSKESVLGGISQITGKVPHFYRIDVTNLDVLEEVFIENRIDGIIHFAGLKAVGESVLTPLDYYHNNIMSTIALCKMCLKYGVDRFIFSSSATVYGDQLSPLNEEMGLKPTTNPYGETKVISERILADTSASCPSFSVSLLRYFNPVGAHPSGLIGEDPNGVPNNLMPFVSRVAAGRLEKLSVFGDDYDTPDGTGIRDYIHVEDLARGHVKALENLRHGVSTYNIGTGKGTSVLELVNAFMKVNEINIPYEIVPRRPGDLGVCYADPSKAERELGWKAVFDINDMVRDAWHFERKATGR